MSKPKRPTTDPLKAVAYIRVSTEDQALGPDAQRVAIARWATSQSVAIVGVYEDLGVSGSAPLEKRPGLLAAMHALEQHGAGVLVVAKRDRLARDVVIAATVESILCARGTKILSADGTSAAEGPEGMLMRGLVDLFAQYERAVICSRTTSALAVKKSRGERVGSLPIGYGVEPGSPHLIANEEEQRALRIVTELHASGHSVRAITRALNERGIRPRGKQWHQTTIVRLLARGTGT